MSRLLPRYTQTTSTDASSRRCYLVWPDGVITSDDGWLVVASVEELLADGRSVFVPHPQFPSLQPAPEGFPSSHPFRIPT